MPISDRFYLDEEISTYSSESRAHPSKAFCSMPVMWFLRKSSFCKFGSRPNSPSDLIRPISLSFSNLYTETVMSIKFQIFLLLYSYFKLIFKTTFQIKTMLKVLWLKGIFDDGTILETKRLGYCGNFPSFFLLLKSTMDLNNPSISAMLWPYFVLKICLTTVFL